MPFKDGQVRVSQSSSVFLPYALTKDVHYEDNIIIQTGLTLSRKKKIQASPEWYLFVFKFSTVGTNVYMKDHYTY